MDIKGKVIRLDSVFQKSMPLPTAEETIDSIFIEGYANTTDVDRSGDVIPKTVWESGIQNYLKNPIILAYHDHDEPIGRMVDYRIEDRGLFIKARISAAAEDVFNLVKDGVLTAFSVGFIIKDATYDSVTDLFIIKELELLEVSVVSVPANQDSTFSLSKSFDNDDDYNLFKKQFSSDEPAKEQKTSEEPTVQQKKEIFMDPKDLEVLLAKTAAAAAQTVIDAQATAAAEAAQKAAEETATEKRIADAVAKATSTVATVSTGAELLLADIEKRLESQETANKSAIAGLEATIKEKAAELEAIQKSKMSFDKGNDEVITYSEKEAAYFLSKITGKSINDTKYGSGLVEKAGAHVPSATWELEVSRTMENEVRRRLVVAPLMRSINMQTNVMTMPVNPEAGDATWITNAQFGTTASPGSAQTHQLKEITLNAFKVSTLEYLAYEEEEDSLLVLLPTIRDAMVRRVARAIDKAYLLGAGAGADPVKGLAAYDGTSAVTATNTGACSIANLRSLRKDLGAWGLEPSELAYIVSTEVYYDLLDDTSFQTMDKVGPAATLLTGQVGFIGNTPVLVSSQFPVKAGGAATATTNIGALCVAPGNFIAGNQRGLRFDTQDLVETQRKVLVSSMRTGLTQVTTNLGQGVSVLRWS
jgi:HK97 family phage prohead protease/HK97 family phage major capsid protein